MITDDSSIYAKPNSSGYKLNVNHSLIRPHYERYKIIRETPILSDEQRHEFERLMIAWLEKKAKKADRT